MKIKIVTVFLFCSLNITTVFSETFTAGFYDIMQDKIPDGDPIGQYAVDSHIACVVKCQSTKDCITIVTEPQTTGYICTLHHKRTKMIINTQSSSWMVISRGRLPVLCFRFDTLSLLI